MKAYTKILKDSNAHAYQLFNQEELELDNLDWKKFLENLCSDESIQKNSNFLVFAC